MAIQIIILILVFFLGLIIGVWASQEPKRPKPTWDDLDDLQEQIDTIRKHTKAPPRKPSTVSSRSY
jgi:hypothetical protein